MTGVLQRLGFRKNSEVSQQIENQCVECAQWLDADSLAAGRKVCASCLEDAVFSQELRESYRRDGQDPDTVPTADPQLAGKKVLIIDDDRVLNRLLSTRLRDFGMKVTSAWDGSAAISVARREMPDVVILDIGLPGGDGLGVMERIRNIGALAFTPIIILTAGEPEFFEQQALLGGAHAFLHKPARIDEVATQLRNVLS